MEEADWSFTLNEFGKLLHSYGLFWTRKNLTKLGFCCILKYAWPVAAASFFWLHIDESIDFWSQQLVKVYLLSLLGGLHASAASCIWSLFLLCMCTIHALSTMIRSAILKFGLWHLQMLVCRRSYAFLLSPAFVASGNTAIVLVFKSHITDYCILSQQVFEVTLRAMAFFKVLKALCSTMCSSHVPHWSFEMRGAQCSHDEWSCFYTLDCSTV